MFSKKHQDIEYKHVPGPSVQPRAIKEGLLNKETSHKNWRLRYVYLLRDAIYCYATRGGEYVKTVIPLGPGSRIFDIGKGPGLLSGFFFSVTGVCSDAQKKDKLFREREGKAINFYADSKEDKFKWMNAIGFVIAGKIDSARAYSDKKPPQAPTCPHPARKVPSRPPPHRPDGAPSPNRKACPPAPPPRSSNGGGSINLSLSAPVSTRSMQHKQQQQPKAFLGTSSGSVGIARKGQVVGSLHQPVSAASSAAEIGKGNRKKFEICAICCSAIVVAKEKIVIDGKYTAHENCFKCAACSKKLNSVVPDYKSIDNTYFCIPHYELVMDYRRKNESPNVIESSTGKKWDIDWTKKKWSQNV